MNALQRLPRKAFLTICFFGDLRWNLRHMNVVRREWNR